MARLYSYATTTDVTARLTGATVTASSRPNLTQIGVLIDQTADELDAILSDVKYAVPVPTAATAAFRLAGAFNSIGAAMYAANAMPQGDDGKHVAFLERRWDAILAAIKAGDTVLPGYDRDSTVSLPRYPGAPDYAPVATPYFTREPEGGR